MTIEQYELDAINLIKNKIACAKQAMNINIIPEIQTDDRVRQYLEGVINILSGYTYLEQSWWDNMFDKYKLDKTKHYNLDLTTGEIKL